MCSDRPRPGLLVIVAALTAVAAAAPADSPPGQRPPANVQTISLTLAEAIGRARAASPRLGRLRALEAAAEAGLKGARADRLPEVGLAAGYTRNSDVPELTIALPGSPPRTIFPNIPDNYRSRLGLALPLYTGGRLTESIVAATEERTAAARDLEGGTADLVLETSAAYWSLVTTREDERVLREAIAAYEGHLDEARNREAVGMAARNEVLAVQVERDRAELARLQSANGAEIAAANLARLLGIVDGTRLEPSEPIDRPRLALEDLDGLVAMALAARPEHAALVARVAAAEAGARSVRASGRPQASLLAGYDYANPNRRILPPEDTFRGTWDVGLNLTFTLFDGGRVAAAVTEAVARAEAARRQLEDLDGRIRLETTSRYLDLQTADAATGVAERTLEAAVENRRVSADRYHAGVASSSDLLDAETALLRAGLDRVQTLAQLHLALASLDRAVGR
ncbi:MAG TPA: TolC family protein [Candidatus Polarisedimenticolia bacterium]|nr:TolC family protein [Candidatus Polarisedimenticolia bacterium]